MSEKTLALNRPVRPPLGLAFAALLRADSTVLLRGRVSGIASLLVPIVIVVVTGFGKRSARLGGPDVLIGLAITIGLVTSSLLGYSLGMAADRASGVLQRLRTTPTPTWAIMVSRLVVQVVANLVMAVIVVIVGTVLYELDLSVAQYAAVLAIAVLGAAVFLAIGQALVGLLNSVSAVNAVGRVLLIALIFLGLLGDTGILGSTVQAIAQWSPIGALMRLFSQAFAWSAWDGLAFGALGACAGYILLFAFIGIRWFRWNSR